MPRINNYTVGLTLDAKDYIKNSTLSRSETSRLVSEINRARTPADKYERTVNLLSNALKKGAIDQATYNRLLQSAKERFDKAGKSGQSFAASIGKTAKAAAGAYLSIAALRKGLSEISEEYQEVDRAAKKARAIGESVRELEAFRLAAEQTAGIDVSQADTFLTKLQQKIGQAVQGFGELGPVLQRLGLDAKKLARLSPVEQFLAVSEAIAKVESETEQAGLAVKFFEEAGSELLPLLRISRKEFDAFREKIDRFGVALDENKVKQVEATNDALSDLGRAWDGLKRDFIGSELVTNGIIILTDAIVALRQAIEDLNAVRVNLVEKLARLIVRIRDGEEAAREFDEFLRVTKPRKEPPGQGDNKPQLESEHLFAAAGAIGGGLRDSLIFDPSQLMDATTRSAVLIRNAIFTAANGQTNAIAGVADAIEASARPQMRSFIVGTQEAFGFAMEETNRRIEEELKSTRKAEALQQQLLEEARRTNTLLDEIGTAFDETKPLRVR